MRNLWLFGRLALLPFDIFTCYVVHPVVEWWLSTVVATWEETVKSVFREVLSTAIRFLSGLSAFLISLLVDRDYYRRIRNAFDRPNAWQQWQSQKGPSTFNALIERHAAERRGADEHAEAELLAGPTGSSAGLAELRSPPEAQGSGGTGRGRPRWSLWGAFRLRSAADAGAAAGAGDPGGPLRRSGSDLFNPKPDQGSAPPGPASHIPAGRGIAEDFSTAAELSITRAFDLLRAAVRFFWRLPEKKPRHRRSQGGSLSPPSSGASSGPPSPGSEPLTTEEGWPAGPAAGTHSHFGRAAGRALPHLHLGGPSPHQHGHLPLMRSRSVGLLGVADAFPRAADDFRGAERVLLATGYPYERHVVITADGYILQMERIPREGSKDAAFFMHGVLDTSLGWVSNGVTGSVAFAAFDQGFDVWLGSCRNNPPRRHIDPAVERSSDYWRYSLNELGELDIGAQLDHIHVVKCAELGAPGHINVQDFGGVQEQQQQPHKAPPAEADALEGRCRPACDSPGCNSAASCSPRSGGGGGVTWASSVSAGLAGAAGSQASFSTPSRLSRCASALEIERSGSSGRIRSAAFAGVESRSPPKSCLTSAGRAASGAGLRRRGSGRSSSSSFGPGSRGNPGDREDAEDRTPDAPPYRLRGVAHSLGGAMMLVYITRRLKARRPHHLSRLILLTPAGFHEKAPLIAKPFVPLTPLIMWLARRNASLGTAAGLYIPTSLGRSLMTKLMADMQDIPALGELGRLFMRTCMSGDNSPWDKSLQLPHYNENYMPAVSAKTALHFMQLADHREFHLYDHGSAEANRAAYGPPHSRPPDIAKSYHLIDVPVDLMAGRQDGVIPPENVHRHLDAMRAGGVKVTFKDFASGHLGFTFSLQDDLRTYILSRLRLA